MDLKEFTQRVIIVAAVGIALGILILLLSRIYPILLLAFACWILATALNIIVNQLRRRGIPHSIAIGLTMTGVIILVGGFALLVIPSFIAQISHLVSGLPETIQSAAVNYDQFRSNNTLAQQVLPAVNPENLEQALNDLIENTDPANVSAGLDLANLLGSATSALVAVGSALVGTVLQIVLILLITIFLIADPFFFERMIVAIVPREYEERTVDILNEVRHTTRQWVGAMLISVSVTGILYWVVLGLILGIPNALALSVIGGLATIVPTIGPTIAVIPVIIFTLAENPARVVIAVILYALVGIVQDRVVTPAVMKRELNIPAAGLVLFQLVAASLLGFIGVVIAVPLLAVLITLTREILVEDILSKKDGASELREYQGALRLERPASPEEPEDSPA